MRDERPPEERALVVVPTYNESETIGEVASRLFDAGGAGVELLVVDDGSPDGTAEVVRGLAREHDGIHLAERPHKLGLGTAYVMGFRWALERRYWAVVEMDADLSHDPADAVRLLAALGDAELAIGSRYVPGGRIPNWGLLRRALSLGGNAYARRCLGFGVRDSTSGFRAYRRALLAELDLARVTSEGYAFQIEMTRRAYQAGGRLVEVPITFVDRTQGSSKMSRGIVLEALASVTFWGLQDWFAGRRTPRRTAGPVPAPTPARRDP
ncbi:MAG: polyprenol monophosphomannose synthase [Actinomycetota bacterium]